VADTRPSTSRRAARVIDPGANDRRRQWVAASPALLAVSALAVVGLVLVCTPSQTPRWYQAAADEAFDARDFQTAAVCYQRLLLADPTDLPTAFNLAQSLEAIGKTDASESLMMRLAPQDAPGYAPAQVYQANRLFNDSAASAASLAAAEAHVRQLLSMSPADPDWNGLMAMTLARQHKWEDVPTYVARCGGLGKTVRSRLATIAIKQGNVTQAQIWQTSGSR
jgi:tetratricopeptide (TPR) repeat protein